MKNIKLDAHFKNFNNLNQGDSIIQITTSIKPNGWLYCVDSKRDNYCFKRIKKVNIVDMDKVELIAHDSSIHYFQSNGKPFPKHSGLVWQAIDYIDFRGSKPAEACAFSCDEAFNKIMEKIKTLHPQNILELTFGFEEGEDFRTDTSFRKCYYPYGENTNLSTLDNVKPKYWLFDAKGPYNGHLVLDKFGRPISASIPNEVTIITVTSGDY